MNQTYDVRITRRIALVEEVEGFGGSLLLLSSILTLAFSTLMRSTQAHPSVIWEEFAAVVEPSSVNAGGNLERVAMEVLGLMPLSGKGGEEGTKGGTTS